MFQYNKNGAYSSLQNLVMFFSQDVVYSYLFCTPSPLSFSISFSVSNFITISCYVIEREDIVLIEHLFIFLLLETDHVCKAQESENKYKILILNTLFSKGRPFPELW